jgi:hypothetical protein
MRGGHVPGLPLFLKSIIFGTQFHASHCFRREADKSSKKKKNNLPRHNLPRQASYSGPEADFLKSYNPFLQGSNRNPRSRQ